MKKYVKAQSSKWCRDSAGDPVYKGDIIVDQEGWEWHVDEIKDDGTVNLNLWEDGQAVEEHYDEYSINDIKREFTLIY